MAGMTAKTDFDEWYDTSLTPSMLEDRSLIHVLSVKFVIDFWSLFVKIETVIGVKLVSSVFHTGYVSASLPFQRRVLYRQCRMELHRHFCVNVW